MEELNKKETRILSSYYDDPNEAYKALELDFFRERSDEEYERNQSYAE